jgi:hypothetical protein
MAFSRNAVILLLLITAGFPITACTPAVNKSSAGTIHSDFPEEIDPDGRFLIYLHGKIIEDQGLPAVSPEYGEYQYQEILEAFQEEGFHVISERRSAGTDGNQYAEYVASQVAELLLAGVPADQITIVGASKGAGIAIYVSHLLNNPEIKYVLLAICHPDVLDQLLQDEVYLTGHVLSIYDHGDRYAGSCQSLFKRSAEYGLSSHQEIILSLDLGHGLLYQPYQEWLDPTIDWATGK